MIGASCRAPGNDVRFSLGPASCVGVVLLLDAMLLSAIEKEK